MGIDLVKYDPTIKRPSFAGTRRKPKIPQRIIIGGGDRNYGPDWHNIEYVTDGFADKYKTLKQNIDISHDLTAYKPFPIQDESILAAYSSHVIEHLKEEHIRFILQDTYRILKPGGYFRISCPNMDLYIRAFLEKDMDFFHYRNHPHYVKLGISDSIAGMFLDVFATQLGERSRHYTYEEVRSTIERLGVEQAIEHYCKQADYGYEKSHYHVNWFSPAKLMGMLREVGFGSVYQSALGQSYCPEMRDLTVFDMGDPKISLFVECKK